MEKLDLRTPDLTSQNVEKIAALFPNCVTEKPDAQGRPQRGIDFDLLRQELSPGLVEGPQERYRLDWPGKREALALANQPIDKTLRPCPAESVDFDTTRNLYIEGDNLDALKLLQETYLGKVKMIYIDPPYNTGNDFIYDDNFSMSREDYEAKAGEVDEEGNAMFDEEKWKQNSSASGRFHSEWLSMMYPRLKLARNLLADDGLILASIDHCEITNIRKILDEVFGEVNFRNSISVRRGIKSVQAQFDDVASLAYGHEYILVYSKTAEARLPKLILADEQGSLPGKWDTFWRGTDRPTMRYELFGQQPDRGQWRWEESRARQAADNYFHYIQHISPLGLSLDEWFIENLASTNRKLDFVRESGEKTVQYYVPPRGGKLLSDNWMDILLSGSETIFDTEKNTLVIERAVRWLTKNEDIVVDFFSGSGTTAHSVMATNFQDSFQRRYVMVQIPEPCNSKSEAFKAGYSTIAEIGKERIRRAGAKIRRELTEKLEKELPGSDEHTALKTRLDSLDTGFRVLKIDSGSRTEIFRRPQELRQDDLDFDVDNLKPDRSELDLLFQVMLDWGVDFGLPVAEETLAGKRVFFIDKGESPSAQPPLAACFAQGLDDAFIRELAARQPLRAVFRDSGFTSDAAKINAGQLFKALSPHTELKTL